MVRSARRADDAFIGPRDAAGMEMMMSNDADWVADVRRWYFSGRHDGSNVAPSGDEGEPIELGYEAAHPSLQSYHWPDAPRGADLG